MEAKIKTKFENFYFIYTFFIRTKFIRTTSLKLVKSKNKLRTFRGWEIQKQKIKVKMIYTSFKIS